MFLLLKIPEEHDLESQIRKEREWRFLRNTRVRQQARQLIQKGKPPGFAGGLRGPSVTQAPARRGAGCRRGPEAGGTPQVLSAVLPQGKPRLAGGLSRPRDWGVLPFPEGKERAPRPQPRALSGDTRQA